MPSGLTKFRTTTVKPYYAVTESPAQAETFDPQLAIAQSVSNTLAPIVNEFFTPGAPIAEVPTNKTPVAEIPTAEIPATEIPTAEILTAETPTIEIPAAEIPAAPITLAKRGRGRPRKYPVQVNFTQCLDVCFVINNISAHDESSQFSAHDESSQFKAS